jgi:single-strand DNA-binding protein
MARSLNTATLIGHVGQDPDVRTTGNGAKVVNLSLATSRQWTDAKGAKQEKTEWHRLIVWGTAKSAGLAGVVEQYVKKGDKLYVEGRIEYRQYEKDGATRYVTEINVTDLILLGGGKVADAPVDDDDSLPF